MTDLHVVPVGDLIEHDTDGECVCGPTDTPVEDDEGAIRFMAVHHSLDGREQKESETCSECGTKVPRLGMVLHYREAHPDDDD